MAGGVKPKETAARKIVRYFRGIFLENLTLKLFSLLIALLLWLFVLGAEGVTATVEIPVFFKVAEDKVLVSDVPDKIKIVVSGPWAAIKGWDTKSLTVEIDLTKTDLGPSVIYFEENLFNLPISLNLTRVNPSQLAISLALKKRKIVRVLPVVVGKPAEGFVVKQVQSTPEQIEIEGAESDVRFVEEVLTEEIRLDEKKESFTVSTKPVRMSKNISFPDKQPIQVSVTIKKDLVEKILKSVPVLVRGSVYETVVEPANVAITLLGPRNVIESLKAQQVVAFVDARKEEGDQPGTESVREVEIAPLPENVKIKTGNYTVKLSISKRLLKEQRNPKPAP